MPHIIKNILLVIIVILFTFVSAGALDFFSTCTVETYRTDLETTLVSPNIIFQVGRFDGYGFWDYYLEDKYYHCEFMLGYTPLTNKPFDRISIITEFRWDESVGNEKSIGLRFKIW